MREVLLVVGLSLLLVALGAATLVPYPQLMRAGFWLSLIGFGFGVPTGVVYHVQLYRALAPRDALPKGWVWRPIALNDQLRPHERHTVLPWCYAGAAGFGLIALGLGAYTLSVAAVFIHGV